MYPFPEELLKRILIRYRKAQEWVWVQEESQNMGGWIFMEPRLRGMGCDLQYVGRDASASPATGSPGPSREQKELVEAAMRGGSEHLVRSVPDGNGHAQEKPAEKPPRSRRPRRSNFSFCVCGLAFLPLAA